MKFELIQSLRKRYIFALLMVFASACGAQYFIQKFISDRTDVGEFLNVAGRQRMLAQKMVRYTYLKIFQDDHGIMNSVSEAEVKGTWANFVKNQTPLMSVESDEDALLMYHKNMQVAYAEMQYELACIWKFIEPAKGKKCPKDTEALVALVEGSVDRFSKWQNHLVSFYAANAEKSMVRLGRIEILFLMLSFVLLVLEAAFVFEPIVQQFERALTRAKFEFNENVKNSRLVEIATLMTSTFHEMKNCIAIGKGADRRMAKELDAEDGPDLKKLRRIHGGFHDMVQRIDAIAKSISSLSREESPDNRKHTSVHDVVESALSLTKYKIRDADIDLSCSSDIGQYIHVNPIQVSQVIMNLLNNSVDALNESGASGGWIRIELDHFADQVSVRVIDSGQGIGADVLQSIWDPFFTTKKAGLGTGVGMYIARTIVERNGGELEYELYEGNTSFYITFPMSNPVQKSNNVA